MTMSHSHVYFFGNGNGSQGLSPKYVSNVSLKVFSSALYSINEIKHHKCQL